MKNYRKFLIPIVLVVLLVLGVSRLDIQSVKNHDMTILLPKKVINRLTMIPRLRLKRMRTACSRMIKMI